MASGRETLADRMRLTVVIPAFNEEHRLPGTLARCAAFLAARPDLCPAEIVVVDDGSRDATARVVESFSGPPSVAVRLVRLPANRGKGAAVRAGLAASRGERVLISDADLATPIEELDVLLASSAGIVAGSRALRRELIAHRQPLPRDLLGRLFNVALRGLRLTRFSDTQCGFKLLDGELARRLAGELRLDGFAFDVELLARAEQAGVAVEEVPVRWSHMDASRVRPLRHGLRMVLDAVRVRHWLWRGR